MTRVPSEARISASLSGLGKSFVVKGRQVDALCDVDLEVHEGEYVVIVGPSGCGKSTLIRCIAGLESPSTGSVTLNGTHRLRRGTARRPQGERSQPGHGVPELRALAAHERGEERRPIRSGCGKSARASGRAAWPRCSRPCSASHSPPDCPPS